MGQSALRETKMSALNKSPLENPEMKTLMSPPSVGAINLVNELEAQNAELQL